jgi:hypothetical protein
MTFINYSILYSAVDVKKRENLYTEKRGMEMG